IRPKRTTRSGERPLAALTERGVEYVEVRCIDLNPFEPLGINAEQIRFLDTFLLLCMLAPSPADSPESRAILNRNQTRVVERGREPGLQLETDNGLVALSAWATQLLAACEPIAQALDQARDQALDGNASNAKDALADSATAYAASLQAQKDKVARPALTPSARVIAAMATHGSFYRFTMHQAEKIQQYLQAAPIASATLTALQNESADSLRRQAEVEAADTQTFEEFLEDYLALP
ncbi:MAG: glutamate--cysteine ligase, partial [Pseudomonadales bacterium]|nr:glutamate--cysteine ligase [Pseudomonadales bacterium]